MTSSLNMYQFSNSCMLLDDLMSHTSTHRIEHYALCLRSGTKLIPSTWTWLIVQSGHRYWGLGLLADTQIRRHANWPTDFIKTTWKWPKAELHNLSSVIRSFDLIMFGRNNLFDCDRFISSPTGRWGTAKLVSSYSPILFVLKLSDATLLN